MAATHRAAETAFAAHYLRDHLPEPDSCRWLRAEAGLTVTLAAQLVGVHRITLHRWEAGESEPSAEHIAAYSALLRNCADTISRTHGVLVTGR